MGKHSQYGVILDAGSSGTRLYVYEWKTPAKAVQKASSEEAHSLPKLKLKASKKIHPGVSTFGDNVSSVGSDHLQSLIDKALEKVPSRKVSSTPIFLMATAGVRFLPKDQQRSLLDEICSYLRTNTDFGLPDCNAHVQVISGETEGLYGWIATNYLLGGFDHPDMHNHGQGHSTFGFLDMGGASAQIAFAPNSTEAEKHANDLKLVRFRRLDGQSIEHRVFTATWLGFGANRARSRYIESLQEQLGEDIDEIPDPCMPSGLRTTLEGEPLNGESSFDHGQILVGVGKFDECLRKTYPLLGKDAPCEDEPCLLNGQHVPAIDFDVNHFVGVSEYWHTTHGVFGSKHNAYALGTYQRTVQEFCSRDWDSIEKDITRRKKTAEQKAEDAREACFKASWLINVLYEGIGIPRVGLEDVPDSGINATKEILDEAEQNGFREPFRPVDEIDGVEVSWTLGKMVLYAAGQVEPKGSVLPVGFGSNIASGTPEDFELAGSSPVPISSHKDEDGDDDDWDDKVSSSSSMIIVILLLLLIGFLLRKPERRRRILSYIPRRRKSGSGQKPSRGSSSLFRKLFGRNTVSYDRVMEEGEAAEFELDDVDFDDSDSSDGNDGPRAGKQPVAPRLNIDRSDDMQMPSAMDRNGLVVRTESRERLAPTLLMLNAGRRSRAGSPTRMNPMRTKSPLVTPLDI